MDTTTRLTIRDLKRAAARVGARVEQDPWQAAGPLRPNERWTCYQVIAPDRHVWMCDGGIHMLRVEWCNHFPEHKHEAIKDAIERIAYGTEPCQDDECDFCDPPEESQP